MPRANREERLAYSRQYYQDNKEAALEYQREYNAKPENKERKNRNARESYKVNRSKIRAQQSTPEAKATRRARQAKRKSEDPEYAQRLKDSMAQWQAANKEHLRAYNKAWHAEHRDTMVERMKCKNAAYRLTVLKHYSPDLKCAYCGEDWYPCLQVDHINGDGHKHRKMHMTQIIKANFPPIYQILCANCNKVKNTMNDKEFRQAYPDRIR